MCDIYFPLVLSYIQKKWVELIILFTSSVTRNRPPAVTVIRLNPTALQSFTSTPSLTITRPKVKYCCNIWSDLLVLIKFQNIQANLSVINYFPRNNSFPTDEMLKDYLCFIAISMACFLTSYIPSSQQSRTLKIETSHVLYIRMNHPHSLRKK